MISHGKILLPARHTNLADLCVSMVEELDQLPGFSTRAIGCLDLRTSSSSVSIVFRVLVARERVVPLYKDYNERSHILDSSDIRLFRRRSTRDEPRKDKPTQTISNNWVPTSASNNIMTQPHSFRFLSLNIWLCRKPQDTEDDRLSGRRDTTVSLSLSRSVRSWHYRVISVRFERILKQFQPPCLMAIPSLLFSNLYLLPPLHGP